jgi:hypothetical protein
MRARCFSAPGATRIAAFFVGLAVSVPSLAQSAPQRSLGKADAEYSEPFTSVAAVRELRDGRVIVVDVQEKSVHLLAANFSSSQKIGRTGAGPGEYQMPLQLLAAPADTTLLFDVMGARFIVLDPTGKPVNTVSLLSLGPPGVPIGPQSVKGIDKQGRLLYQGLAFTMGSTGIVFGDSAPVLRYDFKSKKIDTLAFARMTAPKMQMGRGAAGSAGSVRVGAPAFPVVDEWGLLPDGRVAIVRGKNYRVDYVGGVKNTTAAVPYEPVKVTDADKEAMRDSLKKAREVMKKTIGELAASRGAKADQIPSFQLDEPSDWPAVKPPFTVNGLRIAPNGQLWITRLGPAGEKGSTCDVIDTNGRLLYRLRLPERTSLVGIGAKAIYTVRTDEDDLQYLQRYKLWR